MTPGEFIAILYLIGSIIGAGMLIARFLRKRQECIHVFDLSDWKLTGEDGDRRVRWPCEKCGKVFYAHCATEIATKHGPYKSREIEDALNKFNAACANRGQ